VLKKFFSINTRKETKENTHFILIFFVAVMLKICAQSVYEIILYQWMAL
jgi:hypothetical protein